MSEAVVDLVNRLQSSSSPSSSDKKEFTELSPNNMEAVILHVNRTIAEKLAIEIPNNQIDTVCYGMIHIQGGPKKVGYQKQWP